MIRLIGNRIAFPLIVASAIVANSSQGSAASMTFNARPVAVNFTVVASSDDTVRRCIEELKNKRIVVGLTCTKEDSDERDRVFRIQNIRASGYSDASDGDGSFYYRFTFDLEGDCAGGAPCDTFLAARGHTDYTASGTLIP